MAEFASQGPTKIGANVRSDDPSTFLDEPLDDGSTNAARSTSYERVSTPEPSTHRILRFALLARKRRNEVRRE